MRPPERVLLVVSLVLSACVPSAPSAEAPPLLPAVPFHEEDAGTTAPALGAWQATTESPRATTASGLARELGSLCAREDGALDSVAARIAERLARGSPALDPSELGFELRVAGSPFVWPRSWSYSGKSLDAADTRARASKWLASFSEGGTRSCGAAHVRVGNQEAVALVAVDALADLEPVPSIARPGQWLDVRAKLLVRADEAKVVVLGPRGAPRTIPTTLEGGVVRARFAPNSPGTWLLQVVTVIDSGPRPALEALVHAGVSPPTSFSSEPAPGEEAASSGDDDGGRIFAMVNAVRKSEGLGVLRRDERLDHAAESQATAMRDARTLGHDVGRGTVRDRLESQAIEPTTFGENVARAASPERAHRVIWASPSHRGNLLESRYDAIGIGTARGPDGVWVCEVFAKLQ